MSAVAESFPTGSRRVCAVRLHFADLKLLLISVYMPYESDDESSDKFLAELSVIEYVINQKSDYHVILGGDFNVDFSRSWLHAELLVRFCEALNLDMSTLRIVCWTIHIISTWTGLMY